jgi:hypothetical protein
MEIELSRKSLKGTQISNLMKVLPVRPELFHVDEQIDGQRERERKRERERQTERQRQRHG